MRQHGRRAPGLGCIGHPWASATSRPPPPRLPKSSSTQAGARSGLFLATHQPTQQAASGGAPARPCPPGEPYEFPADYPRHSLGMYTEYGLAYLEAAPQVALGQIKELVTRCMRLPARMRPALRTKGSEAVRLRGEVPRRIHAQGFSEFLRPLRAHELELGMGYPPDSTSSRTSGPLGPDWGRISHLGNGFSVQVVSALLRPFARAAATGASAPVIGDGPTALSREEALRLLLPAGGATTSS